MGRKDEELAAQEQQVEDQELLKKTPVARGRQVLGLCELRVGGSRMRVRCMDGKTRICRIPGRLRRKLWVREGDILLIEPWELSGETKGDVLYKYKPLQVKYLQERGLLKQLQEDEF